MWVKAPISSGGFPYCPGIQELVKLIQFTLSDCLNMLNNPVERSLDMSLFAPGASAWGSEPVTILKDVSTNKTAKGENDEPFLLGTHRTRYVTEVFIYQLLTDTKNLGELSSGHLFLTQEVNHLTSYGQEGSFFFLVHFSGECHSLGEFISKIRNTLKA